jgi:ribosomal protein S18 acetylase RimI-like enzyme
MNRTEDYSDISIRDYRKGDFDQIAGLWEITEIGGHQRGDTEKTIEESLHLGGRMLVMESNKTNRICGTSWMTFDGRRIHLHHLGILPAYQGKGLAKLLLKDSLRHIREKGYQVKLEVQTNNYKAINLYRKAGFEHLGNYQVYIIRNVANL